MRNAMVVVLGFCLSSAVVFADDLTDPVEILRKVDAAAKAVKVVSYKASFKGVGAAEERLPAVEGKVTMIGWIGMGPEKYRVDAKIKRPGSSETIHVTAGSDGDEFYMIDHANKKAYVDIDQAVLGSNGRFVQGLFTLEFLHPAPFNDEIIGKTKELKGSKTIGGEDCYEIHVTYANDQQAIWHFSKKDFLPRARQDVFRMPEGDGAGSRLRVLTDVVVDPKLGDDAFKFTLPEGYTKTDDFAP